MFRKDGPATAGDRLSACFVALADPFATRCSRVCPSPRQKSYAYDEAADASWRVESPLRYSATSMKTPAASIEELNDVLAATPFLKPYGFMVKTVIQANAQLSFRSWLLSSGQGASSAA